MEQAKLILEDLARWEQEYKDDPYYPPIMSLYKRRFHMLVNAKIIATSKALSDKASKFYQDTKITLNATIYLVLKRNLPPLLDLEGKQCRPHRS